MTGAAAAFLRFSRDKRGYEHFYLVQPIKNRRGKTRSRILYWFRTPPGVRVGRLPFDADVQRAIEAQNPGVTFDWKRLLATPIPPPSQDVERWRERRRLERAEKAARRALREADAEVSPESDETPEGDEAEAAELSDAPDLDALPGNDESEPSDSVVETEQESAATEEPSGHAEASNAEPTNGAQPTGQGSRRRRRRRRGGRRHKGPAGGGSPSSNGVA